MPTLTGRAADGNITSTLDLTLCTALDATNWISNNGYIVSPKLL